MSGKDLPQLSEAQLDWSRTSNDIDHEGLLKGITWRRIVAFFIDLAIIILLMASVWVLVILSFGLFSALLTLLPLVPIAYHTLMIAGRRSATIGMQFMGIEIHSQDGKRSTLLQSFAMTALFYLSISVTGSLILIIALFNDKRRCVHDILSGTIAVNAHSNL